jgi:hypothetical protein
MCYIVARHIYKWFVSCAIGRGYFAPGCKCTMFFLNSNNDLKIQQYLEKTWHIVTRMN